MELYMKKRMYIILCILTAVFVLSTAAVCSLCSSLDGKVSAEGLLEKIGSSIEDNVDNGQNSQDDSESKGTGSNSDSNGSSSDKDSSSSSSSSDSSGDQNQGNSDNKSNESNKSAKSGNNPPVINSISVNSDTFSPGMTYKFTSDVTDPDNDTLYYGWHIDAGYTDTPESPIVNWTVPNDDGLYIITLTVNDGWGGSDSKNKEILVGKAASNPATVINDIIISPSGGIYTDNTYTLWCDITDTIGLSSVDFSINGGKLHSQDANDIKWDTPGAPGTYTVNVTVTNKAGNKVSGSKNFIVEQARVEISDLIVQIDYIEVHSSYYLTAVIIDPKGDISSYEWSSSGGGIHSNNGYTAVWDTPDNPGTYSLTLKALTFNGGTVSRTEEFEVKARK
jgi:hypothetical protein